MAFYSLCAFCMGAHSRMGAHSSSWCSCSTDYIRPKQTAASLPLPISITFTITYRRPWHHALTADIAKIKFQTSTLISFLSGIIFHSPRQHDFNIHTNSIHETLKSLSLLQKDFCFQLLGASLLYYGLTRTFQI